MLLNTKRNASKTHPKQTHFLAEQTHFLAEGSHFSGKGARFSARVTRG
jgi:hypothetical protein